MVEGGLPGQTGAIFHFRPYPPISGAGKGLSESLLFLLFKLNNVVNNKDFEELN